ncbi:flotillin family protein, partial [Streptomyces chrestomyceticus]
RTVTDNVAQGVELLSSTTGVDLAKLLKNVSRRATPRKFGDRGAAPATADGKTGNRD